MTGNLRFVVCDLRGGYDTSLTSACVSGMESKNALHLALTGSNETRRIVSIAHRVDKVKRRREDCARQVSCGRVQLSGELRVRQSYGAWSVGQITDREGGKPRSVSRVPITHFR